MITLVQSDQKINFKINWKAVDLAGVTITSKVIELARLVGDDEQEV